MMVPRLLVSAPVVGNKPTADAESPDGQQFGQLLDEKKDVAGVNPQLLYGGLPVVHFQPAADGAKSSAADEADDAVEDDVTGEALLALLNQCQENKPSREAAKTDKPSLAEDNDSQQRGLTAQSFQPLMALKNPEPTTQAEGEATSEKEQALISDSSSIPLTTNPVINRADNDVSSAFLVTHLSVAKPDTHSHTEQEVTLADLSADTHGAEAQSTGLDVDALQSGNKLLPARESELSHSGEGGKFQPELTLSAMTVNEPASTSRTSTGFPPASGLLTQEVGTPAWQQSLGQQVACFTRDGIQHAELRLHPEELGSLQITLQLKNEQAQLHFVSASHQVRAAIEAAVPHLRTSLAESGIELGQSSVGADMAQGWNHSGNPEHSARQNFSNPQTSDVNTYSEEQVEIPIRTASITSGVNTFA